MLDAPTIARLGPQLDTAFAQAGLRVERARMERGNVRGWEPVDGVSVLVRLMAMTGWRIVEVSRAARDDEPDSEAPYLRLVSDVAEDEAAP